MSIKTTILNVEIRHANSKICLCDSQSEREEPTTETPSTELRCWQGPLLKVATWAANVQSKVDNFRPLRAAPLSGGPRAAKAPILIAAIFSFFRCFSSPSGQRWQYSHISAFWHPLGFHIHAHGRHCPCWCNADPLEGIFAGVGPPWPSCVSIESRAAGRGTWTRGACLGSASSPKTDSAIITACASAWNSEGSNPCETCGICWPCECTKPVSSGMKVAASGLSFPTVRPCGPSGGKAKL